MPRAGPSAWSLFGCRGFNDELGDAHVTLDRLLVYRWRDGLPSVRVHDDGGGQCQYLMVLRKSGSFLVTHGEVAGCRLARVDALLVSLTRRPISDPRKRNGAGARSRAARSAMLTRYRVGY